MNKLYKILLSEKKDEEFSEEIERVAKQYPIFLQGKVKEAFQSAEEEEYERAVELCCELMDELVVPEIHMLMGISEFMQGNMELACGIFHDLTTINPDNTECRIYQGMTEHALRRYKEAVKTLSGLYPLSVYRPFYYISYGDSLLQIGKKKQGRDVFRREVDFFEETGKIVADWMLDGAFENLLYLDVILGNGKYPEDIKLYYEFLDQVEMTEDMQKCLAGNIVYFCDLMSNKWYRPLFLELITYIRDKGFLTSADTLETLASAFSSWESFEYHDDRKVSAILEDYLNSAHAKRYSESFMEDQEMIEAQALTYSWYMCQYIPGHLEEIDYLKEKYPYSYAYNAELFEKIQSDAKDTAEKIEKAVYPYVKRGANRRRLKEELLAAYQIACETGKEPVYVSDGAETYRRIQPKVGRNDPCPCGSGKKYKKCCGR